MNFLPLRARTLATKEWFQFSIADIPVTIDTNGTLILLAKPNSPKLSGDEIHYGDPQYGVFEGDVIQANGVEYLVRYNCGFSAINKERVSTELYKFSSYKIVGDYVDLGMQEFFRVNKVHQYAVGSFVFPLTDILCGNEKSLFVNGKSDLIELKDIRQSCRYHHDGKKLYFGDLINNCKVELIGGRIAINTVDGPYDIYRKEILDGYNTWNFDRP